MTPMTDAEQLEAVKTRLGITGDYLDGLIAAHIADVKCYLSDAGISETVLNSSASLGAIARGVSDNWNYGSGDGEFSKTFYQRLEQLRRVI